MPTISDSEIPFGDAFVARLLALPTTAQQLDLLQQSGVLQIDGLGELMDVTAQLMQRDLEQARQLTQIFTEPVAQSIAPMLTPRAKYLRAQIYALDGEFEQALALIGAAQADYLALGDSTQALRTNLGLMHVYDEMGRYQDVLDIGQHILDTVADDTREASIDSATATMMTATAHQNRGACFDYLGRYDEALAAYALAEPGFRALGMAESLAQISSNRGMVLLGLGRCSDATTAFESAAVSFQIANDQRGRAMNLINVGQAELMLGNYSRSLDALNQAGQLLMQVGATSEQTKLDLDTANAFLALNLYPEASAAYRSAITQLGANGMVYYEALAQWGLGAALIAQGRWDDATQALLMAVAHFTAVGNTPMRSSVLLEQAGLMMARQDVQQAQALAQRALDMVASGQWPVQQAYALLRMADLVLPDLARAETLLVQARDIVAGLSLPQLCYRLNQRLGHVYLQQDRDAEARAALEQAVTEIEGLRATLSQETLRASFLRDKMAAYEDLVALHLKHGDEASLQRAFAIAEQAKSRALVDLFVRTTEIQIAETADSSVATQLRTLQADLNALYNQALDGGEGHERRIRLAEMNAQATQLEVEISRLRLQLPVTRTTAETWPPQLTLTEIRKAIPTHSTLIAYYVIGEEILAFVHQQDQLKVVRQLSDTHTVRAWLTRLGIQWARFRGGEDFVKRNIRLLEKTTQSIFAALYAELIAPLESLLPKDKDADPEQPDRLIIVPHGLLHQLPFHALFDGQHYLIERFEISYAPSATVMALCQERERSQHNNALVLGVSDPLIPSVIAEVQAIASCLPNSEVYLDAQATLPVLRDRAAHCDVLHLACHGLFRSDNPMFSALKLSDGWLNAGDVLGLDLQGTLVVLSACESGLSEVFAGDEIIGLTRAFLGAGASTLVVSLWLVEDETTATLMASWYRQMGCRLGRAAALRKAQLQLLSQHPHPYYWAPFVLLGQTN